MRKNGRLAYTHVTHGVDDGHHHQAERRSRLLTGPEKIGEEQGKHVEHVENAQRDQQIPQPSQADPLDERKLITNVSAVLDCEPDTEPDIDTDLRNGSDLHEEQADNPQAEVIHAGILVDLRDDLAVTLQSKRNHQQNAQCKRQEVSPGFSRKTKCLRRRQHPYIQVRQRTVEETGHRLDENQFRKQEQVARLQQEIDAQIGCERQCQQRKQAMGERVAAPDVDQRQCQEQTVGGP